MGRPKPRASIERWSVHEYGGVRFLVGHIENHDRQNEFKKDLQATSPLVSIDEVAGIAETGNTVYELGEKAGNRAFVKIRDF